MPKWFPPIFILGVIVPAIITGNIVLMLAIQNALKKRPKNFVEIFLN